MTPPVRFSVVIPVLDGAHVLARTVPAVCALAEAAPGTDVIYVDDGSADGSAALIERLGQGRVRVVRHARNRGRAAARNTGAAQAQGDALAFLDADVVPDVDLLHGLSRALRDGVAAVAALVPGDLDPAEPYHAYLASARRGPRFAPPGPLSWRYFVTAAAAVRRDAFEAAGGFDEAVRYGEDLALGCALARRHPHGLRYAPEAHATLLDNGTLEVAMRKARLFGHELSVIAKKCPNVLQVAGLGRLRAAGPRGATLRRLAASPYLGRLLLRAAHRGPHRMRPRVVRYLLAHALASGYADAVSSSA